MHCIANSCRMTFGDFFLGFLNRPFINVSYVYCIIFFTRVDVGSLLRILFLPDSSSMSSFFSLWCSNWVVCFFDNGDRRVSCIVGVLLALAFCGGQIVAGYNLTWSIRADDWLRKCFLFGCICGIDILKDAYRVSWTNGVLLDTFFICIWSPILSSHAAIRLLQGDFGGDGKDVSVSQLLPLEFFSIETVDRSTVRFKRCCKSW